MCVCLWVRARVSECEGLMMETTKYESIGCLGYRLRAELLPRQQGKGDPFRAFPISGVVSSPGKTQKAQTCLDLWGPVPTPSLGPALLPLNSQIPSPSTSKFFFCLFVLFLFSVNIYFLFWTCRDQLRFWSGGEGADDWVFLFFPFSLGFWCLNLKKNNHKYIYKQMTYL